MFHFNPFYAEIQNFFQSLDAFFYICIKGVYLGLEANRLGPRFGHTYLGPICLQFCKTTAISRIKCVNPFMKKVENAKRLAESLGFLFQSKVFNFGH